jgi:hypothetical protein
VEFGRNLLIQVEYRLRHRIAGIWTADGHGSPPLQAILRNSMFGNAGTALFNIVRELGQNKAFGGRRTTVMRTVSGKRTRSEGSPAEMLT